MIFSLTAGSFFSGIREIFFSFFIIGFLHFLPVPFCLCPDVSNVLCRCDTFEDVEQFVPVSGTTLTQAEQRKLSAFIEGAGRLYCRHACGICETGCPHGVPVNTVMRYNHYFEAQRLEKYAMQKYAALKNRAEQCTSCSGGCQERCPHDVPIRGLLTLEPWQRPCVHFCPA